MSIQTARRPRVVPGRDEWIGASVIARTGVAVFGVSLLLPMLLSGVVARASAPLIVAAGAQVSVATMDDQQLARAYELPRLPEPAARSRIVAPTPEPTQQSGSVVTVSWYGPGFFENRLPRWPWLAANGLPIQFLPDT